MAVCSEGRFLVEQRIVPAREVAGPVCETEVLQIARPSVGSRDDVVERDRARVAMRLGLASLQRLAASVRRIERSSSTTRMRALELTA